MILIEKMNFLEQRVLKLSDNTSSAAILQNIKELQSDVQDYKDELNV